MKDLSFAVDIYDPDGDVHTEGVFIFVGEGTILCFKDLEELQTFADDLVKMMTEVKEAFAMREAI